MNQNKQHGLVEEETRRRTGVVESRPSTPGSKPSAGDPLGLAIALDLSSLNYPFTLCSCHCIAANEMSDALL